MSHPNPVVIVRTEPVAKLLLIGDSGVGKTSIITRFVDSLFSLKTNTTISNLYLPRYTYANYDLVLDYKIKKIKIDHTVFKLQVWDTAGQEKYRSITKNFYKNAMGAIIVFDLTNPESLKNVPNWVRHVNKQAGENVCKLLVGNKADLDDERAVSSEEVQSMSEELGIEALELSAKNGDNIDEAFSKIAIEMKQVFFKDLKARPLPSELLLRREDAEDGTSVGNCC